MKNVLIINQLAKGGIAHYTACLGDAIANNDVKATVLTSFGENEYGIVKNEELRVNNILFPLNVNLFLRLAFLLLNYIIIFFYSLFYKNIHWQWAMSEKFDKYFLYILKFFDKNLIFTAHNIQSHEGALKDNKIHYANPFDNIIVHSDYSKNMLLSDFGMKEDKVFVIPHGNYLFINELNKEISKVDACDDLKISNSSFNVLFFGYIRKYKGLDLIIEVFKDLPKDINLIIAGSCSDFKEYDKLISDNGLQSNILKFINYIDLKDFGKYFYASDVCVFPYRNIYQSGAMQIAFAFKKACIATNLDGFKDNIIDGKNGFMFDINNLNELKSKILYCYNNRDVIKFIGENAYEYAKNELDWNKIAIKTIDLYK